MKKLKHLKTKQPRQPSDARKMGLPSNIKVLRLLKRAEQLRASDNRKGN